MISRSALFAALCAIVLSACSRSDTIAYSADLDAHDVALFTCKSSTSGQCVIRFESPDAEPQSVTITSGESATITRVRPGSGYCATTGAVGAECRAQELRAGLQTVRREKRNAF